MPIIYNSNFANSAGAAMREFKDVNKSYRNTMLKLEDQRLRQEENEARRAQAAQFQQDRLGQQQKQFDVQMDFKQQQLAGSRSRVGDQFAPPTGEGMLNLWGSMGELNASAVKDGRELITGEQQTAFGDQMSGLLGRQVTPDTPITAEELENHPNRRAIYRALTGQYNQMSTLDAQQRLTGSYEGTAQSLMESHPEFAQTPAGLAILDEMSAAYADALQEDELSPQAAEVEAQAFKRAYVAGATRMQDAADVRSDINRRLIETNTRGSRREAVNDILAQLNDPKSQLTADEVRLQALREFDPDSAAQFEAGQAQAAVGVAAAQAAGGMRNAPAPPNAVQVPRGPVDSATRSAGVGTRPATTLAPNSKAAKVFNQMPLKQQRLMDFLTENGVELPFDEEEGRFIIPQDNQTLALIAQHRAPMRAEQALDPRAERLAEEEAFRALPPEERQRQLLEQEQRRQRGDVAELPRREDERYMPYELDSRQQLKARLMAEAMQSEPVAPGPGEQVPETPTPSEEIRRQDALIEAAAAEEQRMLAATAADQQRRKQMADPRGRAQFIAREGEQQQIAIEQMLQDIAPGSRKLAQVLMQNQIPFELDENGHVIITDEVRDAFMQDDVQLPEEMR